MRIRHLLTATVVVALPLAVPVSPASASGKTTIVSRGVLPPGVTAGGSSCGLGGTVKSTVTFTKGPDSPPLGKGSIEVASNNHTAASVLMNVTRKQLTNATTMKIATDYIAGGGEFLVGVQFTNGSDQDIVFAAAAQPWTTTNLLTKTLTWQDLTTPGVIGSGTLAQFLTAYPSATPISWGAIDLDCQNNTASDFAVDDLQFGVSGGKTKIIDFEPPLTAKLTTSVSAAKIKSGSKVSVSAKLTGSGKPLKGEKVTLLRKSTGAAKFVKVKTVKTNKLGVARATQRPISASRYEWSFTSDANYTPVTSKAKLVRIK